MITVLVRRLEMIATSTCCLKSASLSSIGSAETFFLNNIHWNQSKTIWIGINQCQYRLESININIDWPSKSILKYWLDRLIMMEQFGVKPPVRDLLDLPIHLPQSFLQLGKLPLCGAHWIHQRFFVLQVRWGFHWITQWPTLKKLQNVASAVDF